MLISIFTTQGLAENGAKVVVSSRKEDNVRAAVEKLSVAVPENLDVSGVVCHVGKSVCLTKIFEFNFRGKEWWQYVASEHILIC